jgi:glycosyltransferase involved in cell wall biosynthesis
VALGSFNGERFLLAQLTSILAGDRLPTEIVIADDGSTDATLRVAADWAPRAEARGIRVQVLAGENVGVTANFARAIAATSSDVVVLSDQDDVWHPPRLAAALAAFETDPALLLHHSDARLVDENGADRGMTLFAGLSVSEAELEGINTGSAFDVYLRRNVATGATVAFRRSLFDVAAPLPEEWVHDEWLAIIAAAVGSVEVTARQLIDYRQHGNNVIGVQEPTLTYKIRRMLATSPERNVRLAHRARVLADRLAAMPADAVSAAVRDAAEQKARFEQIRSGLPAARIARLPTVLRAARGGRYARFASQGTLDMVRDLLQSGTGGGAD